MTLLANYLTPQAFGEMKRDKLRVRAVPALELRGAALALQTATADEVMISGPAETGKSWGALWRLHQVCLRYPNVQAAIIRKVAAEVHPTILQTYEKRILPRTPGTKVHVYGGSQPQWYDYPNGSRVWIGGMDKPGKVLSSERDIVVVNQAEQLTVADWETLGTRVTGRAGNVPNAQLIGDCNPGPPGHWIKQREAAGSLELLESRHVDNPALYTAAGVLTKQGEATMRRLNRLTGTRKARLLKGLWVQAEGVIYENYDPAVHLLERFDIPLDWRRVRVCDFGTVHPFVCSWFAFDHDGNIYRYREIYMTRRSVTTYARWIKGLSAGERIETTICDHDAGERLTLEENGIPNIAAIKDVLPGIGRVQDRLGNEPLDELGNVSPASLFFLKDSLVEVDQTLLEAHLPTCTEQEFEEYVWANNATRETPVKENDHGMDCVRYLAMWADTPTHTGLVRAAHNPLDEYRG